MERWTGKIDQITEEFKQAFGKSSVEELNWKLHDKTWSIAQNIEHSIKVNESYYPTIHAIRQGTYILPFIGKIGFVVKFTGKALLNSVQPNNKRRIKTFLIWEPDNNEINPDILNRFEEHQTVLKQIILSSQDLLEKGTVIASPANKNIVYTLETAFDIMLAHEQRHLKQAKEILSKQTDFNL